MSKIFKLKKKNLKPSKQLLNSNKFLMEKESVKWLLEFQVSKPLQKKL